MNATPDDFFADVPVAGRRDALVATATHLGVVDVPHAAHGFEAQGPDADARRAVDDAMAWTAQSLGTRRSQQAKP